MKKPAAGADFLFSTLHFLLAKTNTTFGRRTDGPPRAPAPPGPQTTGATREPRGDGPPQRRGPPAVGPPGTPSPGPPHVRVGPPGRAPPGPPPGPEERRKKINATTFACPEAANTRTT